MASVFYKRKEGKLDKIGRLRGAWRFEDREKKYRVTFNERFANEYKRLFENGIALPIKELVDLLIKQKQSGELHDTLTIAEYSKLYVEDKLADYKDDVERTEHDIKKYLKRQTYFLSNYVAKYGTRRLSEVTGEDIKTYYRERRAVKRKLKNGEKNLEVDSVYREISAIRAMYNHAIRFGKFTGINPALQSGLKKEDKKRDRVLSKEEQASLLPECHRDLRDLIICLLNTGCRINEFLVAQWCWIDFDEKMLHLPKYATKTRQERDVVLNQVCMNVLKSRSDFTGDSSYVFPSNEAKVGHRTYIYTSWYSALERAGIKDLRPHDLRHSFATRLLELGIDSEVVRIALGHSGRTMTSRYLHPVEAVRKAVDLLGITYFGLNSVATSA